MASKNKCKFKLQVSQMGYSSNSALKTFMFRHKIYKSSIIIYQEKRIQRNRIMIAGQR